MGGFSSIEGWCNPARLHSSLGYQAPMTDGSREGGSPDRDMAQQTCKPSTRTGQPQSLSASREAVRYSPRVASRRS